MPIAEDQHLYAVTFYLTEGDAGNALRMFVQSHGAADALLQAATRARNADRMAKYAKAQDVHVQRLAPDGWGVFATVIVPELVPEETG